MDKMLNARILLIQKNLGAALNVAKSKFKVTILDDENPRTLPVKLLIHKKDVPTCD